jgi:hypothetical protein
MFLPPLIYIIQISIALVLKPRPSSCLQSEICTSLFICLSVYKNIKSGKQGEEGINLMSAAPGGVALLFFVPDAGSAAAYAWRKGDIIKISHPE